MDLNLVSIHRCVSRLGPTRGPMSSSSNDGANPFGKWFGALEDHRREDQLKMVSLNFASWNQLEGWRRRIDGLRGADVVLTLAAKEKQLEEEFSIRRSN